MDEYTAILGPDFSATERGNILITNTEENWLNAWTKVPTMEGHDDVWLQIAFRAGNYPALLVETVRLTEAELAKHINEHFSEETWVVHKMNIDGVKLDENNRIVSDEPEMQPLPEAWGPADSPLPPNGSRGP